MIDLDERLRHVATAMTAELEVNDPSEALRPSSSVRGSRRRAWAGGCALVAAAAAVAAIVWGGVIPAPADTIVAGTGAGAPGVATEPAPAPRRSPVEQFRAAVDSALSEGVTVRIETVRRDGPVSSSVVGPLPMVGGDAAAADVVTSIDGPVESSTSPVPLERGSVHVRDTRDRRSYWQVGPGAWQRATFDEPSLAEQLRRFAAARCVTAASGRSDLVFVSTGAGRCVEDPMALVPGPDQWAVTLDGEGRLVSIEPVVDPSSPVQDARSALTFTGQGTTEVELPDPATVVDVGTPRSWGVDASTGWAVLSDANG